MRWHDPAAPMGGLGTRSRRRRLMAKTWVGDLVLALPVFLMCAVLWLTVCSLDTSRCEEEAMTAENMGDYNEHVKAIREKYEDLFWRQPNIVHVGEGGVRDERGRRIGKRGIKVFVTKKVNQRTLPSEDRIPACLEGVPVEITDRPLGVVPLVPRFEEASNDGGN